jgi:enterochelin esterase family protein
MAGPGSTGSPQDFGAIPLASAGAPGAPIPRPAQAPFDVQTAYDGAFADAETFNKKVHLLFFGAGTAETALQDSLARGTEQLKLAGIHYVLFASPGTAHEWLTWRRDLNDFAPRLFR